MSLRTFIHQNLNFVLSYELHVYMACPLNLQPAVKTCSPGPTEVKYTGKGQSANVSNLEPYTTYNLRVVSYNSVGSSASEWIGFTTEKEREYEKWFADHWSLFLRPGLHGAKLLPHLWERGKPETSSSMSMVTVSLLHIHWNSALGLNCSFLQKYLFAHHLMSYPLSWEPRNLLFYWKWAAKLQNIKCSSITRKLMCSNKYTAIKNPCGDLERDLMIIFRNNLIVLIHATLLLGLIKVFLGCHLNDWMLVNTEVRICCCPTTTGSALRPCGGMHGN